MDTESLEPIVDILREKGLPLFITGRMGDDRTTYLIEPAPIDVDALRRFILKHSDIKIVLSHFKLADEIHLIYENLSDNLLLDSVGFGGNTLEEPQSQALYNKAVYGSGYPLMVMTTGALIVNRELPEDIRREFVKREV
jgi:predicted TIM-barrel fold metal-dependent hydrolase